MTSSSSVSDILNEIENALLQDKFVQKYRTQGAIMEEFEMIFNGGGHR